jgi:hypothetical protein
MTQIKPFLRLINQGIKVLFFIVGMLFILQAPALNENNKPNEINSKESSIFNSDHSKIIVDNPTIASIQRIIPSLQKQLRNFYNDNNINNLRCFTQQLLPISRSYGKAISVQLSVPLNIKNCVLLI